MTAATGGEGLAVVPFYDGFDEARQQPYFGADRSRITDPAERQRVADFMLDGAVALRSTGLDIDIVDPARGHVVPGSFRTDGRWVWSDGLTYYVREHGIAPAADFYAHVVACQYRCPGAGPDAVGRAARLLTGS
jgi:hypothetical protein